MPDEYWATREGREEAMARVVSYMDGLQEGPDEMATVGVELSPAVVERLREELDLPYVMDAIRDAVNDGFLELFHFPAKLLTENGEEWTWERHSILHQPIGEHVDSSDPREENR